MSIAAVLSQAGLAYRDEMAQQQAQADFQQKYAQGQQVLALQQQQAQQAQLTTQTMQHQADQAQQAQEILQNAQYTNPSSVQIQPATPQPTGQYDDDGFEYTQPGRTDYSQLNQAGTVPYLDSISQAYFKQGRPDLGLYYQQLKQKQIDNGVHDLAQMWVNGDRDPARYEAHFNSVGDVHAQPGTLKVGDDGTITGTSTTGQPLYFDAKQWAMQHNLAPAPKVLTGLTPHSGIASYDESNPAGGLNWMQKPTEAPEHGSGYIVNYDENNQPHVTLLPTEHSGKQPTDPFMAPAAIEKRQGDYLNHFKPSDMDPKALTNPTAARQQQVQSAAMANDLYRLNYKDPKIGGQFQQNPMFSALLVDAINSGQAKVQQVTQNGYTFKVAYYGAPGQQQMPYMVSDPVAVNGKGQPAAAAAPAQPAGPKGTVPNPFGPSQGAAPAPPAAAAPAKPQPPAASGLTPPNGAFFPPAQSDPTQPYFGGGSAVDRSRMIHQQQAATDQQNDSNNQLVNTYAGQAGLIPMGQVKSADMGRYQQEQRLMATVEAKVGQALRSNNPPVALQQIDPAFLRVALNSPNLSQQQKVLIAQHLKARLGGQ